MTQALLIVGGSIFAILGLLHAAYTLADIYRPRRLVPADRSVIDAMAATGVRLARGSTTMWRAWVGFNFSHSVGAVLFGSLCVAVGLFLPSLAPPKTVMLVPVAIGAIYALLSVLYWFIVPTVGIVAATLCFLIAWLVY